MKTWMAKKEEQTDRKWWLVDATDQPVGRLATQIATILRGKNKAQYTPHVDTGDFVVVVNSEKIKFSGNKWSDKKYYRRSRYFGSVKETTANEMREKDPSHIIAEAVKGMLPKNRLSRQIVKKLKVYPGADHPHDAQRPEALNTPAH